jgi:hypothetical protein
MRFILLTKLDGSARKVRRADRSDDLPCSQCTRHGYMEGAQLADISISYSMHYSIQYASADKSKAKLMVEALTGHDGSVCWDREIPLGDSLAEAIQRELDASRCVLGFCSKPSLASSRVKTEARAAARRRTLVPVLLETVQVPRAFRALQASMSSDVARQLSTPDIVMWSAAKSCQKIRGGCVPCRN